MSRHAAPPRPPPAPASGIPKASATSNPSGASAQEAAGRHDATPHESNLQTPAAPETGIDGTLPAAARHIRLGVLAGVAMLIAGIVIWCLEGGLSAATMVLAALLTSPLWLALPGLHRGTRRTYAWTSLALAFYLVLALMETVANPFARLWAALGLFVTFAVFVLLIAYLRLSRPSL